MPSADAALELDENQIVEPLNEHELAVVVSSETMTELRRRHPSGTGQYFVKADGEVVMLTKAGGRIAVSGVRKKVSRALFEHRHQAAFENKHKLDKRI